MTIDVMSSDEAYGAFYETLGKEYPESEVVYAEALGRARRRLILSYLTTFSGKGVSLLDAGCSSGYYTLFFASLGGRAHGIDISPSLVSAAIARSRQADPQLTTFQVANVETYSGGPYDLILFSEVLEHLRHPELAMESLARCLRPRGRMLLSTPAPKRGPDTLLRFVLRRLFGTNLNKKEIFESENNQIQQFVPGSYHYRHDEYFPVPLARWVESFGFRRVKVSTFFNPARFLRVTNAFPWFQASAPGLNLLGLNNLHLYQKTES